MMTNSSKLLWYLIFKWIVEATSSNTSRKYLTRDLIVDTFTKDDEEAHFHVYLVFTFFERDQ